MVFVFKTWEKFCSDLNKKGILSVPAKEVTGEMVSFLVLKHDIENNVYRAYRLAEIESKYGHRGSFYAHAYLLDDLKNVDLLKKMQEMGHEISYHYDVMDSNHGDIAGALVEYEENRKRFEALGFHIKTVCQHGNPIVERVGYTSNRDFFRNEIVQKQYPNIADIMVDYKQKYGIDYWYYSDAGRKFNLIYDPINNDRIKSDDKNIPYEDIDALFDVITTDIKAIISTHPHRWTESATSYIIKEITFKVIKAVAKTLMKIPLCKKIMGKYYYLAKII